MLSYEDVVGLCHLTEDEIRAIADHEHIPDIVAAELGNYLVQSEDGVIKVRRMIIDDMADATRRGDREALLKYKAVLLHFIETHPPGSASGR